MTLGFGFILFKNVDSEDKVMKQKNMHNLLGKWVDCKRAQPKEIISELPTNNVLSMEYVNNKLILV